MLAKLSINNFALIEKLNIDFSDKFSIITGETGAGKSILLGALGLVLGKRADLSSLKNKEEKCVIEADFEVSNYNLQQIFTEIDVDYADNTILRREILPTGKSRAFVNDSPVNLQQLQDLSDYLLDIHSQHQTQELSDEAYQFQFIDAIAGNQEIINNYQIKLKDYKKSKILLSQLLADQSNAMKELDYNSFLLEELLAAKLIAGEQQELETSYEALNNVEFIKENLVKSLQIADDEQIGVKHNLKEVKTSLQKIAVFSENYNQFFERINSVLIEFDDVFSEIEQASEILSSDPEKLELTNQKLQNIYNLQKKHNVQTIEELLIIQNELDEKVVSVSDLEIRIKKGEQVILKFEEELNTFAKKISENRNKAIPILSEKIIKILEQLGMPNSRFKIDLLPKEQFLNNGKDEISFLFSANKGTDFGLIKKVASGGELSRIMLAVKAILAQYSKLPTIIFDEIDTGVSGEIANKMGEIMKSMSNEMQVFAITHLPQIAAKGTQHYKVFKYSEGNNTISELKLLNKDERIKEIAEMLSGKDISDSALNHAMALLN
jgi:DNA repair protein RecN (Recombination protein N)